MLTEVYKDRFIQSVRVVLDVVPLAVDALWKCIAVVVRLLGEGMSYT